MVQRRLEEVTGGVICLMVKLLSRCMLGEGESQGMSSIGESSRDKTLFQSIQARFSLLSFK